MKNFSLLFFIILNTFIHSQGKIFYDIKVPVKDKIKLAHIETVLTSKLLNSDFANVSEGVADYAIWLVNYRKTALDKNVFEVDLDIEVRKTKLWGKGDLIKNDNIRVRYVISLINEEANTHYEYFKEKYDNWSEDLRIEAVEVSKKLFDVIKVISWKLNANR